MIRVTDTMVLDDREVKERFVRATAPGGKNLDKDATAVELRFDLGRASLPLDVSERLVALAGRHVTTDGVLVVVSRADRSQARNRTTAWARLEALLKRAAAPPKTRKSTKPRRAVRSERTASKQRRSEVKRSRSGLDED